MFFSADIIFLFVGLLLGFFMAMNHKEWREQKTYEQLDEELRKDLLFYKNTCSSQKIDIVFYKDQAKMYKEKYENLSK
jgi:hypothetical protein